MPPSARENCRSGNCWSLPENSRSTQDHIRLDENKVIATANGASGALNSAGFMALAAKENPGTNEPEPKCSDSGMCASEHTRQRGSQWSVWNEGSPPGTGLSGKEIVRAPLAAIRSASL